MAPEAETQSRTIVNEDFIIMALTNTFTNEKFIISSFFPLHY